MRFDRNTRRRWLNWVMGVLAFLCVVVALIPLGSIVYTAAARGGQVLSVSFLTARYPPGCSPNPLTPTCPTGGIGPAIYGTLVLLGLASLFAIPAGVLAGIYLSEYGRGRFGRSMSFFTDVMTGSPSIVVGIFAYTLFLFLFRPIVFSTLDGAVALAVIMVPIVTRTTEEALRLVPATVREAAYALGIPRYRAVLEIVLSAAKGAVLTGVVLSVMRAGGEAAPLLLTAFGNPLGFSGITQPAASIPVQIYYFGTSSAANWVADAWGAALILILMMLLISLGARLALRNRFRGA